MVENSSVSMSPTLSKKKKIKDEKVEHYIRMKTPKHIVLRF